MSEGLDVYGFVEALAKKGINAQKKKHNDYIDAEGLLVCGVCGEHRQKRISVQQPVGNATKERILTVSIMCKCERDAEDIERKKAVDVANQEKIEKFRSMSLMDDKFKLARFENFKQKSYNLKNLTDCKRYVAKFDRMVENNQGLIFWGDVGTGKSFAAACIANELLSKGVLVVMISFVKVLQAIQGGWEQETEIINRLNKAKLLILDDLGAERSTDYALEKVYNIIDSRYRRRLPMLLTTNLTLDDMKRVDDIRYSRIYDRVLETCYPMQFTGPSWRKVEAAMRYDKMKQLLEDD